MLKVKIDSGEIIGKRKKGIASFKGIPYAAPPTGELRFAPPQVVKEWEEPLDCTGFRASPLQCFSKMSSNAGPMVVPGSSEDCLFLNVWTPAELLESKGEQWLNREQMLPVYVFFHGGAFSEGSGSEPLYGGKTFAEKGIVYINVNYRLNVFGFLSMATLYEKYGTSGNFGLLDQIKALEWVQRNIASFGGDPAKVTVGGESAGALSVSELISNEKAKGLFHRGIIQSGGHLTMPLLTKVGRATLKPSFKMTKNFLSGFGVEDTPEGLGKLRAADPISLTIKSVFNDEGLRQLDYQFGPVFDGYVMAENPIEVWKQGDFHKVDLLIGYNTDEGSWFAPLRMTQEQYEDFIKDRFLNRADAVLKRFPPNQEYSPGQRARQVVTLAVFRLGMKMIADRMASAGCRVFAYHFDYPAPGESHTDLGVRHALELFFVFNQYLKAVGADDSEGRIVAEVMHTAWANFIKTGDPNKGQQLPLDFPWKPYTLTKGETLRVNSQCQMEIQQFKDDLEFFEQLLFEDKPYYFDR